MKFATALLFLECASKVWSAPGSLRDPQWNQTRALAVYGVSLVDTSDALLSSVSSNIPDNAADIGMWSTVQDWPILSTHTALLPDGTVVTYGTLRDSI